MIFIGTDRVLPHLIGQCLEHLPWLWRAHAATWRDSDDFPRRLDSIAERLCAHADVLILAGDDAREALLAALDDDDHHLAAAAAHVLLWQRRQDAADAVIERLLAATGPRLSALAAACCQAPVDLISSRLTVPWHDGVDPVAIAAGTVSAWHARLMAADLRLPALLIAADPAVRAGAWAIARLTDSRDDAPPVIRPYRDAWADADAAVRRAALGAAAWTRHPDLLGHCRAVVGDAGRADERRWLAILGSGDDARLLASLPDAVVPGSERCELIARSGQAFLLPRIIDRLDDPDAQNAAVAGLAFARVTGKDIDSGRRRLPAIPPDADPDFIDPVAIPDVQLARDHWRERESRYASAGRWRRGLALGPGDVPTEVLPHLDNEAHWDARLRAHWHGTRTTTPMDADRLPPPALHMD